MLPSSLRATDEPKFSLLGPVLDAFTYACCPQILVGSSRVNTYTAPECSMLLSVWSPLIPTAALSSLRAPTASVLPSPLKAIEEPKRSLEAVLDAFTYASCDQC